MAFPHSPDEVHHGEGIGWCTMIRPGQVVELSDLKRWSVWLLVLKGQYVNAAFKVMVYQRTWVTTIFLMTNSAKGSMDLYSMVSWLPGQGTKGTSAFSGQYTSHFFYVRRLK